MHAITHTEGEHRLMYNDCRGDEKAHMMALLPEQRDIEVELTLLPTEQGGRQGPAFSGYRPQFYYDGHDWDAVHDYGDVDAVWPGQTVTAYLSFLSPQCHVGKLPIGTTFLLREGQRVVGRGRVLRILNLEQNARQTLAREQRGNGIWPLHMGIRT